MEGKIFSNYKIIDKINTIDKRMDIGTITKVQILYFTVVLRCINN